VAFAPVVNTDSDDDDDDDVGSAWERLSTDSRSTWTHLASYVTADGTRASHVTVT